MVKVPESSLLWLHSNSDGKCANSSLTIYLVLVSHTDVTSHSDDNILVRLTASFTVTDVLPVLFCFDLSPPNTQPSCVFRAAPIEGHTRVDSVLTQLSPIRFWGRIEMPRNLILRKNNV